jgi:methylated-DNA-protein-cysteine methyltransferase related protein
LPAPALRTWLRRLRELLHRIFRCVSSEFPLRATSVITWVAAGLVIHLIKHERGGKVACAAGDSLLPSFFSMSWDPVYKLVKQIPRGRVTTYGALAKALQLRGGARTAGRALAATPSGRGIPWHRVVGERGKLLIPEPYASLQRKMLESEGIKIIEFRVDFARHGWEPKNAKKSAGKTSTKPKRRTR